jgi:uncharacterized protein (TIGR04255 family)
MQNYPKLSNQPLKLVLAEFRFSAVMGIEKYISELQEILRPDYPTPASGKEQLVEVQPTGINLSNVDNWSFISMDKKSAININQHRLVYLTSDYPRFEGFSSKCKEALKTLQEVVKPGLIERIGLRYSDLILIDEGENIADFVDSSLAPSGKLEVIGDLQQQRNEYYILADSGGLFIRTLYGKHNLSFLPDIHSLPIRIESEDEPSERMVLDFDHFWESKGESIEFETQKILDLLESLHKTSREAFWNVTTDFARKEKWL